MANCYSTIAGPSVHRCLSAAEIACAAVGALEVLIGRIGPAAGSGGSATVEEMYIS